MPYDPTVQTEQQNRLPPGWRLTYAPDWGWFCQTAGERDRVGDFDRDAAACVDAFLASPKCVPRLRTDDIWVVKGDVKYLDPSKILDLPAAIDTGCCPNPHCGEVCVPDYDSTLYVGTTEPVPVGGVAGRVIAAIAKSARVAPKGLNDWTEVWDCPCGWRYRLDNSG